MDAPPRRKPRRLAARLAWTLVALLVVLGLLRTFVLGLYRVDSTSMAPYLHGDPDDGEWVLVLYRSRPQLERFDPVVILRAGERDPVVKRVAGLGGETVQVSGGDLLVDGRRLPPAAPRPRPVAVYDQRFEPLDQAFQLTGPWERDADAWRMSARAPQPALDASAAWGRKLLDERLDADGRRQGGRVEAGDAVLELEVRLEPSGGRLGLRLSEEGDRFEATLEPAAGGATRATLWRRSGRATPEPLAHVDLEVTPGAWHHLRFSNVDNRLALELDGRSTGLVHAYEANTPLGGVPDPGYRHLMPRVAFWASGLEAGVRGVRVLRDVGYTERGEYGVRRPLTLGPDELYVLGDNSSESVDSREQGPVRLEEVVGIPLAVVWPPRAWRPLRGPEGAP
jgi:signal peptidase I